MKKTMFAFMAFMVLAGVASAQEATGASKFAWSQGDNDASSLIYKHYSDGAAGVVLSPVTCTALLPPGSPHACETPIPAYTPGFHTVDITATRVAQNKLEFESGHSNSISFNMIASPATPQNFHLALYINEAGQVVWAVQLPV